MPKYNIEKALKHIDNSTIDEENKEYIHEYINDLSAQGLSKARQAKYLYILKKLSEMYENDFSKAKKKDMQSMARKINNNDDLSNWTKHDYLLTLKRFIRWLRISEGQKLREKHYPEEVDWIKPHKYKGKKVLPTELLTMEDVKTLADNTENLRDRCLIMFLYESGARIGEAQNIKLKDVEFDEYGAKVHLFGKTGARFIRVIASAPSINNWLMEHPKRNTKTAPLFCGIWGKTRGKEMGYRYINKLLRKTAKKAGINKPVNPHHFRHSRASELAQKLTESQLCEYLGWVQGSGQASTYVHLSGKNLDDAILKMHGLMKDDETVKRFSPIECPRCKTVNDPSNKFCSQCGLGLDERTMIEFDKQKEKAAQEGFIMQQLKKSNPEALESIVTAVLKELNDNKEN